MIMDFLRSMNKVQIMCFVMLWWCLSFCYLCSWFVSTVSFLLTYLLWRYVVLLCFPKIWLRRERRKIKRIKQVLHQSIEDLKRQLSQAK
jgi:uncharacterized protein (DUF2062 family)